MYFLLQFEDDTGMYEHNYYQDEGFATLGYDFNAGRAFPQNFSTIFEDDDQV